MKSITTYTCDKCGAHAEIREEGWGSFFDRIPEGWEFRRLDGKRVDICGACRALLGVKEDELHRNFFAEKAQQ